MARRIRPIAALVLSGCLALSACHSGSGGSSANDVPSTTRPSIRQNPCSLTTPSEVEAIFRDAAAVSVAGNSCRYLLGNTGSVRLTVISHDTRDLAQMLPGNIPISGLGSPAIWAPVAARHGGVLVVKVGTTYVQLEALLLGEESKARVLAQMWAKKVLPRIRAATVDTYAIPGGSKLATPCDLLTAAQRLAILGKKAVAGPHDANTCSYQSQSGVSLVIGPFTEPASSQDLLGVRHIVTVGSKRMDWPLVPLKGVGDAAVVLRSPQDKGNLELYVLSGARMVKVAAVGEDPKGTELMAKAIAIAITSSR